MFRKTSLVALLFIFSTSVFSQTAPTKIDDVVKITTTLIQLDVTVTDSKGKPIQDLKPDEIEIFENGQKQVISNFSFVSTVKYPKNDNPAQTDLLVPYKPSKINPEQVRRTIALVVDDLTLSFGSTYLVKRALRKYVDEQVQDGDLVAIIRTGSGVGALQQFTNNKLQLLAAIDKIKFNLGRQGGVGTFNYDDFGEKSDVKEFRENIFTSGTLGALNFIVKGMNELPGRKSVVLLSDGLRLIYRDDDGKPRSTGVMSSLRRLIDFANRSSVVFYTIDAKGLLAPGGGAEFSEVDFTSDLTAISDSQDGLRYLARETGGFAIVNQNHISTGINRILDDQSYYLVGYQPDDETFSPTNSRFNKIEIKVKRDGAKVRYRSGFFGIGDDKIIKPKRAPLQTIMNALTTPFGVNDIALSLNTMFVANEKRQSYLKSYLHIAGDSLVFARQNDGNYKAIFDLIALNYGDNGVIVDEYSQTFTMQVAERDYQKIIEKGFIHNFNFPVKKLGGYQMRVAVRDTVTNKVGSANQFVEVPNLKKKRLTISGVVLESMTNEQFSQIEKNPQKSDEISNYTDLQADTTLRKFKTATVLRFGYDIYNAKYDANEKPDITAQAIIYQDGKTYFTGKPISLSFSPQQLQTGIFSNVGRLRISNEMPVGEYVLQVIITDSNQKNKHRIATQWFDFEVVN